MGGAQLAADAVLLFLLVMLAGLFFLGIPALNSHYWQQVNGEPVSEEQRRWRRNSLILGATCLLVARGFGLARAEGFFSDTFPAILGVVVTTSLGIALIWSCYRWLRERDELLRRIEVEALALSFGLAAVGTVAVGQLQNVGVFGEIRLHWMILGVLYFHAISRIVVRRRYR
jgi:hypothetical protein